MSYITYYNFCRMCVAPSTCFLRPSCNNTKDYNEPDMQLSSCYTDTLLSKYTGLNDSSLNIRPLFWLGASPLLRAPPLRASISSDKANNCDWYLRITCTVSSANRLRTSKCSQLPSNRGIRKPVEDLAKQREWR